MSGGSSWSSCEKASSPPAEAPIPTIGNDSSRIRLAAGASPLFRVADAWGRETRFPTRVLACLLLSGPRLASVWANRQTLEDISLGGIGLAEYKRTTLLSV